MDFNCYNTEWTLENYRNLVNYLKDISDIEYRKFNEKIISKANIIGVRTPILRAISKQIFKGNYLEYLNRTQNFYFEEDLLEAFVIGLISSSNEADFYIKQFIPKINNWGVCDSFCLSLKIVKSDMHYYFNFFSKYSDSVMPYGIRVMLVIFLNYYVCEDYLHKIFLILNGVSSDEYYVNMALGWLLSVCYVKFPNETLSYIKEANLNKVAYNKTLQKIIESNRVSKEAKSYIRSLRNNSDK